MVVTMMVTVGAYLIARRNLAREALCDQSEAIEALKAACDGYRDRVEQLERKIQEQKKRIVELEQEKDELINYNLRLQSEISALERRINGGTKQ